MERIARRSRPAQSENDEMHSGAEEEAMGDERYLGMQAGDLDGKPYAKHWKPEKGPAGMRPAMQHPTRWLGPGCSS